MSTNDEEPYSTIFASLKHPIRRRILRMLSKKPMSFSEMLEVLGASSSFLTYHLENLGELVGKTDDGKYRLSSFGEAAMSTMTKVEDIPATAPQQSPQTKPKKATGRNVAIALGLICIVSIALIAYFAVAGISAQNRYNNLQNQNKQLQTWLNGNETLLNQIGANNTNLQNQVNDLTSILNLEESTVWDNQTINQPANSYTEMYFDATYAGYVSVDVTSSTTDTTYVEVLYNAHGINYGNKITVGTNGTAVFPVVPALFSSVLIQWNNTAVSTSSSNKSLPLPLQVVAVPYTNIEIIVGNTNTVGNVTETLTITYYY
jgi:DNA-binding transcriptional ArsR family regulator/cell division protein FtsB